MPCSSSCEIQYSPTCVVSETSRLNDHFVQKYQSVVSVYMSRCIATARTVVLGYRTPVSPVRITATAGYNVICGPVLLLILVIILVFCGGREGVCQYKEYHHTSKGIPIAKIRLSHNSLIFIMEISMLENTVFILRRDPGRLRGSGMANH